MEEEDSRARTRSSKEKLNQKEESKNKKTPKQEGHKYEKKYSRVSSLHRTVSTVIPYFWTKAKFSQKLRVLQCICMIVAEKVMNVLIPITFKSLIDGFPENFLWKFLLYYVLLRLLVGVFVDWKLNAFLKLSNHVSRKLLVKTFHHIHELSLDFHIRTQPGYILRVMDKGLGSIYLLLEVLFFNWGPTLLELVLVCGMLSYNYGGRYAFITMVTVCLYIYWTVKMTEWQREVRKFLNEKDTETSSTALDSLLNFETVKYFTAEREETRRYNTTLKNFFVLSQKSQDIITYMATGQGLLIAACLGLIVYLASQEVLSSAFTVGDIVAINSYILQLWSPLAGLAKTYRSIIRAASETDQLFDLLHEVPRVRDIPTALPLKINQGTVTFQNVTFKYPTAATEQETTRVKKKKDKKVKEKVEEGDVPLEFPENNSLDIRENILDNVSFTVPGGTTLAIVGQSGSGKSTIFRLLCRFYDVDNGRIFIDDQEISKVTQYSLRRAIGVVPQDTILFNATIKYNIAFGLAHDDVENVDDSVVHSAAIEARIHDFILGLPEGYETMVGQRGLRLSGGEKQRVAIARTILKNPPILIMDEATSSLDSKTEKEIQKSLKEISKGRTTIIIAHRLSTVVYADQIIVLKGGCIAEQGTHPQLLDLNGEYKSMWETQQNM